MIREDDIAFAGRLADAAGEIALRYFRTAVAVDDKEDASPVTIADRTAEQVMRELIARERPDDGIIGEEFGRERSGAGRVWILDPIDGTKSFISGRPMFGTLVALAVEGVPQLGVIDCSAVGERWVGVKGRRTTHRLKDGSVRDVRVRACAELGLATLYCSSPLMFKEHFPAFERVREKVKLPMYGGDCYAYGLVASGFADIDIEAGLQVYDYAAVAPVIEGAGGIMTDWRGKPLDVNSDGRVVAAGDSRTHAAALGLLGG
ncbi:MAG: histidinol-phosphatase [Alphaproteobacteria bacterium]|nr:histidinol-phosphatase [Alphaproteobacteria bacterium]